MITGKRLRKRFQSTVKKLIIHNLPSSFKTSGCVALSGWNWRGGKDPSVRSLRVHTSPDPEVRRSTVLQIYPRCGIIQCKKVIWWGGLQVSPLAQLPSLCCWNCQHRPLLTSQGNYWKRRGPACHWVGSLHHCCCCCCPALSLYSSLTELVVRVAPQCFGDYGHPPSQVNPLPLQTCLWLCCWALRRENIKVTFWKTN